MKQNSNQATKFLKGAALTWAAVMLFQTPLLAADQEKIPDTIDINIQATCADLPGIGKDKKEVKGFKHTAHAEYVKGNQEFSDKPYTDDFTCAACHTGATDQAAITGQPPCDRLGNAVSANGGGKKYKNFIHGICLNCHKKMKKAKKTTGPTSCKQCHGK